MEIEEIRPSSQELEPIDRYDPEQLGHMLDLLKYTLKAFKSNPRGVATWAYPKPTLVDSEGQELPEREASSSNMVIQQALMLARIVMELQMRKTIRQAEIREEIRGVMGEEISPERLFSGLQVNGVFAGWNLAEKILVVKLPLNGYDRQEVWIKFGEGTAGLKYPREITLWKWIPGTGGPNDLGKYELMANAKFSTPLMIQQQEQDNV